MTEQEFRESIAVEALTWIETPYHSRGTIKKVGVNCSYFVFAVARNSGVIPPDSPEPDWYTPQFATHSTEERLIKNLLNYGCIEISEEQAKKGDVVVYKSGKSYGHSAIILDWPTRIIQVIRPHGCQCGHGMEGVLRNFKRRFFTLWKGAK